MPPFPHPLAVDAELPQAPLNLSHGGCLFSNPPVDSPIINLEPAFPQSPQSLTLLASHPGLPQMRGYF